MPAQRPKPPFHALPHRTQERDIFRIDTRSVALTVVPLLAARLDMTQAFLSLPAFAAVVLAGVVIGLPSVRAEASGSRGQGNVSGLVRNYRFWCLVAFHFLGMLSIYALMGWIPTYFRNEFGYTAVEAGLVAALTNVGLAVFSPMAGAVSDKLGSRTPVLLAGSALLVATLGVLMVVRDPWVAVAASGVAGIAVAFCLPVLVIMIGESFARYGPAWPCPSRAPPASWRPRCRGRSSDTPWKPATTLE